MLQRWLFHLGCVLALAWPAFLNGQPFYFPDTTAYTRAADSAAYIFSGRRIVTEWTDHYRHSLDIGAQIPDPARHVSEHANDLGTQSIMAGRSPYFGVLLWLSYVFSQFWLFVLIQAAVAYALIRVTLRVFDLAKPLAIAGCVAALSLLTSLSFFVSLLMPDLLAAFGILAFLLLAVERGRLSRSERWMLLALILLSAISHATHILIIAALGAVLAVWGLACRWPRPRFVPLVGASLLIVVAGVVSMMVTSLVVERTFGRKPLLVPLLTARFLADGAGIDYLQRYCPEAGFAACRYRDHDRVTAAKFLWSIKPGTGAYMLADTATRRALSEQDHAFAMAVLRAYPVQEGTRILGNGWQQFIHFDIDLFNYRCAGKPRCWSSLPESERTSLRHSLGGEDRWPQHAIAVLHYLIVGAALLLVVTWAAAKAREKGDAEHDLRLWLLLLAVAFIVNAGLGGGISDPQPRYQARIIWLLPFVAMIVAALWQRRRSTGNSPG